MSIDEVIEAAKAVPALISEIYKDLAQPGVRRVGRALESTVQFVAIPTEWLRYFSERQRLCLEHNLDRYREKLAEIPEDKIFEVRPEIGIPILEKLAYVEDENLSELFLNLLTTASNTDTVNLAHPSFFPVIEHLSPDEAKLLLLFKERNWIAFYYTRLELQSGEVREFGSIYGAMEKAQLTFPNNLELYMCNLESLGILKRKRTSGGPFIRPKGYAEINEIELSTEINEICKEVDVGLETVKGTICNTTRSESGVIHVTVYGRMFIQACVSKMP
ncbi:MAG: DUF4393 domain-containing protein [Desulfomonilaceae bacterium]